MSMVQLMGGSNHAKRVPDDPKQKVIVYAGELFSLGDQGPNGWRYYVGIAPPGTCDTIPKPASTGWVSAPAASGWVTGNG